jgi:hypothetical protein
MNFTALSNSSRHLFTQNTLTSIPFEPNNHSSSPEDNHSFNEIIKQKTQLTLEMSTVHESLLKYLVLENFKVLPCSIKVQHNHKQCQFYHYPKDRKRVGDFYSADLCEYIENNQTCPNGDKCTKSHSCVEQLYRPDKYKTKFCSQYPYNTDNCEYGDFCSFAHNEEEILIELLHRLDKNEDFFMFKFKTVMCPFSSLPHDKAQCVYSHNWQDFRRKPNLFHYNPTSCNNWKFNNYIVNYSDGCQMSGNCDKCHGWKELDYHPLVYKTKPCANGMNCHRTFECPFYHSEGEKRNIDLKIQMNVFRYAPKNRMAALKKKNEPTVTSTNNPAFQNKLRKITNTDVSNSNSPNLCPMKHSSVGIWGPENVNKLSPLKHDSFSLTTNSNSYCKQRKSEEFFASNMTFSKFYPGFF